MMEKLDKIISLVICGMMGGAVFGSFLPPYGALIGAIVGGIILWRCALKLK